MVWDLVREVALPPEQAISHSRLKLRTFWRRYYEARRDIAGEVREMIGAEEFAKHLEGCSECQAAERVGRSDRCCKWMQKQIGRRSPREKGVPGSESAFEATSIADWQEKQNQERHKPGDIPIG